MQLPNCWRREAEPLATAEEGCSHFRRELSGSTVEALNSDTSPGSKRYAFEVCTVVKMLSGSPVQPIVRTILRNS
jgi:hypothetical protein